jgi:riboflavin synthase
MFTGIVEVLGVVASVDQQADSARLTIDGSVLDDVRLGDSIAVNGVCLTAAALVGAGFTADVMHETLRRSTLGTLAPGDPVNLERAVTPTTRLGGHIVQGHVDGIGTVSARRPAERWHEVEVRLPADLRQYVVLKGSITIDGVSLTVSAISGDVVTVSLIPETLARTTLGSRAVGDGVNIEVDILAKYVERLLGAAATNRGPR